MAPKSKKETKAPAKSEKAESPKKSAGKSAKEDDALDLEAPALSQDELEEQEDAAEEAAATGSGGGNAAALAAAAGSGEMSASFKNFRHHPDMENFYRFIYENDLRHEALAILDTIMTEKQERRAKGKSAH